MSDFSLHPQLQEDCFHLSKLTLSHLLLLNNAYYQWLILVPEVTEKDLHQLPPEKRDTLLEEVQKVSNALDQAFRPEKINTACIGNLVPQLHYHIVGRSTSDPAWPGVVWGHGSKKTYSSDAVKTLRAKLLSEII